MIGAGGDALLRKATAVGLLAAAIIGAGALVIAPVAEVTRDAHEELVAARERLAGLRSKREDVASLEAALKAEAARATERPSVFDVSSSAAGWERLEAQLRTLAGFHDAELSSVRPLRLEDESGLKALRVDASFRAPRERLTELIAAIETVSPPLFFEKVRVSAERPAGSATGDERVEMSATIRGLAAIAPPQPAAARR